MSPLDALTNLLRRRTTVPRSLSRAQALPSIVQSSLARPTVGMCAVLPLNGRDILVQFIRQLSYTLPMAPEECPEVTYLYTNSPESITISPGTCFTLFVLEEHFVVQIIAILPEGLDTLPLNCWGRGETGMGVGVRISEVLSRAVVVDENIGSAVSLEVPLEAQPDHGPQPPQGPPVRFSPIQSPPRRRPSRRASIEGQRPTPYPRNRSLPELPSSSSIPSESHHEGAPETGSEYSQSTERLSYTTGPHVEVFLEHPTPPSRGHQLHGSEELSPLTMHLRHPTTTPSPKSRSPIHLEYRVMNDPPPPFSPIPGLTEYLIPPSPPGRAHHLPPVEQLSPLTMQLQFSSTGSLPKPKSSTRLDRRDLKDPSRTPAAQATYPTPGSRASPRVRPGWDDVTATPPPPPATAPIELKAPDYTSEPSVLFSSSPPQKKGSTKGTQVARKRERSERREPIPMNEESTTVTRTPIMKTAPLQSPSRAPVSLRRGASLNVGSQNRPRGPPYDPNSKLRTPAEAHRQETYNKLINVVIPAASGPSTSQAAVPKVAVKSPARAYDTPKSMYKSPRPPPRPPTDSHAKPSTSRRTQSMSSPVHPARV